MAARNAAVAARGAAVAAEPIAAHRAARNAGASAEPSAAASEDPTAARTAARIADPWAPPGAGHSRPASVAGAAARTLVGSRGRDGADRVPVEVAPWVARAWAALTAGRTAVSIAARTAAPTRAVDPWADRVEAAASANVPPAPLPRGSPDRDLCGSGAPCRAGHQPPPSSIRCRRSIRHRGSSPGRGRPTRAPISNGRRPVGSPRISGCPGRVRPAAWPGMRTTGWRHQPMIDRPGMDRPTTDRPRASAVGPTAAAARAVRRTNERLPATRCAIRRDCGARLARSPLPAGHRDRFVAVRSHTNTHRYRRRPTPFRVHPVRTGNPPYGCGRHGRATDTTRVPLGWEDLIGHSSAPDGRSHHVCTTDFKPDMRAFVPGRPLWTVRSFRTRYAARHCPISASLVSPHPAAPPGQGTAEGVPGRRVRSARPCGLRHAASPWRHA